MKTSQAIINRFGAIAVRLFGIVALTLLLAGAVAPHVRADANNNPAPAMDKGKFKEGCEAGGGSYVEDASDDSFGCNLKGGGSIHCTSTTSPCTYNPAMTTSGGGKGFNAGVTKISSTAAMQMLPNPTPTPEPTFVAVSVTRAKVVSAKAP